MSSYIHETAEVSNLASVGSHTKIWNNAQIRENARIGQNCIISKDVYIDVGVSIGNSCKVQNGVSIYAGVFIEDNVFIGPNACFTNDLFPRALNENWQIIETYISRGASIGANATIVCVPGPRDLGIMGANPKILQKKRIKLRESLDMVYKQSRVVAQANFDSIVQSTETSYFVSLVSWERKKKPTSPSNTHDTRNFENLAPLNVIRTSWRHMILVESRLTPG